MYFFVQGMAASLLLLSFSFLDTTPWHVNLALTSILFYTAFFGIGFGPGAWLLPCELFSTSIRAKGISLSTFLACAISAALICNFLTIRDAMTWPVCFLAFAGVCLTTIIILYMYLPETKNRSLEAMTLYFAKETGDFAILEAEQKLRAVISGKKVKTPDFQIEQREVA